jgi:hypothetical protein
MISNNATPAAYAAYAEYRRRQKEYELEKWQALSAEEQAAAWLRRQTYLWTAFLTNNKWYREHLNPVVGCPACGPYRIRVLRGHPEHFACVCGTYIILDRWLPDGIERVTMMTSEGLKEFFKIHEKVGDLYDYPLDVRLRDLKGLEASADSDAAI